MNEVRSTQKKLIKRVMKAYNMKRIPVNNFANTFQLLQTMNVLIAYLISSQSRLYYCLDIIIIIMIFKITGKYNNRILRVFTECHLHRACNAEVIQATNFDMQSS